MINAVFILIYISRENIKLETSFSSGLFRWEETYTRALYTLIIEIRVSSFKKNTNDFASFCHCARSKTVAEERNSISCKAPS